MSQYKTVPFYNNWLDMSGFIAEDGKGHKLNISQKMMTELGTFNDEKLKKWRIEAAQRCHASLGPFKAYCHTFDIHYREIEFDILSFLARDNLTVTQEYGGVSPQFNTHYRFVEILTHMGYTGVCFGGNAPDRVNGDYGSSFEKNAMHWLKCHDKFQIAVQGSFLSFSPELSLALAVSTPEAGVTLTEDHADWDTYKEVRHAKYLQKVIGYKRIGFDIIQQDTKYTGFEKVKDLIEEQSGDGWAFERQFRDPLAKMPNVNTDMNKYQIALTTEQQLFLDSIYFKHFPPGP